MKGMGRRRWMHWCIYTFARIYRYLSTGLCRYLQVPMLIPSQWEKYPPSIDLTHCPISGSCITLDRYLASTLYVMQLCIRCEVSYVPAYLNTVRNSETLQLSTAVSVEWINMCVYIIKSTAIHRVRVARQRRSGEYKGVGRVLWSPGAPPIILHGCIHAQRWAGGHLIQPLAAPFAHQVHLSLGACTILSGYGWACGGRGWERCHRVG
ncbi:hypothetical protein GGS23DRAFT_363138 [Durotheca rogersii]|uniref:uncharacterized protein n=1 Tax=Durotheca rogersii TaxID=419775 RepID=UPI0022210228|nr:uncharacterized protein GGS23DRAFT_363138 [Durotheca rogersii]KAI5865976.1 hypothetical protein GGS23DRAFT_363138 [Durotheca rogersii]